MGRVRQRITSTFLRATLADRRNRTKRREFHASIQKVVILRDIARGIVSSGLRHFPNGVIARFVENTRRFSALPSNFAWRDMPCAGSGCAGCVLQDVAGSKVGSAAGQDGVSRNWSARPS
jgi:hypothetical protein